MKQNGLGAAGVVVISVFPHSPAARAGLSAGDVLLQLGGEPVANPEQVMSWVAKRRAGDSAPVLIQRGIETRLLRAELEGAPDDEDRQRLRFIGTQAPDWGPTVTLQGPWTQLSETRGRVVLIEFWASYCAACRYLSPTLEAWHRRYRPEGLEVIGITVDTPELAQEVSRALGLSYTLLVDSSGDAMRNYSAHQIPMIFLLNRSGVVEDVMVGASDARASELETKFRKLLSEGK